MNRLTPELWLISTFNGVSDTPESRELDFNLARRSAVIVNSIDGYMELTPDATSGFDITRRAIQEVDTDPDNTVLEFNGALAPDAVEIDSSRMFRQIFGGAWDTASGAIHSPNSILQKDWTLLPMEQRPISITNLRHHINNIGTISNYYHVEIFMRYFIVELNLLELGIINASRR